MGVGNVAEMLENKVFSTENGIGRAKIRKKRIKSDEKKIKTKMERIKGKVRKINSRVGRIKGKVRRINSRG